VAKEKFTQETVISALRETRGMVTVAARHLQCSPQTIENYVQRHAVVAEAKRQEREAILDIGELALVKAVEKGEGWAVCFLLKTVGRDRGYVERTEEKREVTGDIRITIEAIDDRRDSRS
jgi:hypothetical protein